MLDEDDILEAIYLDREQGILACRSAEEKQVSDEVKLRGYEEKLRKTVEQIHSEKLRNKINDLIDHTLEDLLYKDGTTMEKYYKQGFKDGVNLLIKCAE